MSDKEFEQQQKKIIYRAGMKHQTAVDKRRETCVALSNEFIDRNTYPDVVRAGMPLSLSEHRVLDFIISLASSTAPSRTALEPITFSLADYAEIAGLAGKNYRSGQIMAGIKASIKALSDKSVWLSTMDEKYGKSETLFRWFQDVSIHEDGRTCTVCLSQALLPFITNLHAQGGYSRYALKYTMLFTSKYSVLLYRYLLSRVWRKTVEISLRELRERFGVVEKSYTNYKLEEKCLKPAVRDINSITNLKVAYAFLKSPGSKASTHIVFDIVNLARSEDEEDFYEMQERETRCESLLMEKDCSLRNFGACLVLKAGEKNDGTPERDSVPAVQKKSLSA